MSLRIKLLLFILSLLAVVVGAISYVLYQDNMKRLKEQFLSRIEREEEILKEAVARGIIEGNDLMIVDSVQALSKAPGFSFVSIYRVAPQVEPIFSYTEKNFPGKVEDLEKEIIKRALNNILNSPNKEKRILYQIENYPPLHIIWSKVYHPFLKEKPLIGVIVLAFHEGLLEEARSSFQKKLLLWTLVFLILAIIGAILLSYYLTRPVELLAKISQEVGKGKLDVRAPVISKDEIGRLAEIFNKMLEDLQEAQKIRENQLILEEQIRQAQEIQEGMNPTEYIQRDGYELKGFTRPARGVGGDYYEYYFFEDGKVALIITDVSGKSVSASLVMVLIKTLITTLFGIFQIKRPDVILQIANRVMCSYIHLDRFATSVVGVFDPETKEIEFSNGGHGFLFLYREEKGGCSVAKIEGLPLGIDEEVEYKLGKIQLKPGDILLLYTDGITEARNPQGEQFGLKRLKERLLLYKDKNAEEIVSSLVKDIDSFSQGAPQHDDMTLLVLKIRK